MKNKETKKIKEVWNELRFAFDSISYHRHVDRVLEMSIEESKQHDRFRGDSINRGISVPTEAKYFVIKRIFEYFTGESKMPDPANFMSTQKSAYGAYSMAKDEQSTKCVAKWIEKIGDDIKEVSSWDYCDLIADEDRRRGFKSSPVNSEVSA